MEVSLVSEALKFMVLGMSVVLLFLVVLINLVQVQAKLVAKYFPEEPEKASSPATSSSPQKDMKKITAVISAAITHHNSVK